MDLIKKIIDKKLTCVIISPHQDDAILSCDELISQIAGKTNIIIVNVFTKAHKKPYTLSAKRFLRYCHETNANKLYAERTLEDKKVLSLFPVSIINLNLQDALFRKRRKKSLFGRFLPEFDHIYPTYRWHILKGISKNDYAEEDLKKELKKFTKKNIVIFSPYGIGNHVDHLIARKACEDLFDKVILYADFPYNTRQYKTNYLSENRRVYKIKPDMKKKSTMIKGYKTQFKGLFPDGIIPEHKEIYFTNIEL